MTPIPNDRSLVRLPVGLVLQDPEDRAMLAAKVRQARAWLRRRFPTASRIVRRCGPKLAVVR